MLLPGCDLAFLGETREALVQKLRDEAETFRNKPVEVDDGPPVTDDSVRSAADPDAPIPAPPFWGVRELPINIDDIFNTKSSVASCAA